jgi:hypothetical protein
MYYARVIRVLITSPSDIDKTIIGNIIDYIDRWNRLNSVSRKIVLRPLRWERDVYSDLNGKESQQTINKQIVKASDILIGVFWTRIGTPTQKYVSGSVEEIERHVSDGKPAMLYFLNDNIPVGKLDKEEDSRQYRELLSVKNDWRVRGLYKEISTKNIHAVFDDLSLMMNNDDRIKRLLGGDVFHVDVVSEDSHRFEYNFLPTNDGRRVWYRQSIHLWVEKSPNSAIPDKVFLCYSESESVRAGVRGMIVQCATRDEETGFQVFIPQPGSKDMWLYCRIVNKRGSDWERLGVTPIRYF